MSPRQIVTYRSRQEQCPVCIGDGLCTVCYSVPDPGQRCGTCNGSGKCPDCGGSGVVTKR